MTVLADKRQALMQALQVVLPGRVTPYPRTMSIPAAPSAWIGQPDGAERTLPGMRSTAVVATYPVTLVYDGAEDAQIAGLDDLVVKCWWALTAVPQAHPRRWRPATVDIVAGTVERQWRAAVIDVEVTIAATSFCPDTPIAATIPPPLVTTGS